MAVGNNAEVTKKLKAAITAKLEELGVYVDDELPEYIMVMIANKKEATQMKNDLNLFLGKSTGKFVDWLFDLFDRLQNANSGKSVTPPPVATEDEREKPKELKESSTNVSSKEKERERKVETSSKTVEHSGAGRSWKGDKLDTHFQSHHSSSDRKHSESEKDKPRKTNEKERTEEKSFDKRESDREKTSSRHIHIQSTSSSRSARDEERRRTKEATLRASRPTTRAPQRKSRSRSRTWSDDEFETAMAKRERSKATVASTVVAQRKPISPEPVKVSSQVMVKRKIQPVVDEKAQKGRKNMFMRAMNEASVSTTATAQSQTKKIESPVPVSTKRTPIKNRITAPPKRDEEIEREREYDSDTIVCDQSIETRHGPRITVTLRGARQQMKQILQANNQKAAGLGKRKVQDEEPSPVKKTKKEIIEVKKIRKEVNSVLEVSPPQPKADENDDSHYVGKWDGQIQLEEESSSEDDEEGIDAILAEAHGCSRDSIDDDLLPPTHQLSRGSSYIGYSPTPLHSSNSPIASIPPYIPSHNIGIVLQQHPKEVGTAYTGAAPSRESKERCRFWPNCRQGESCVFVHPSLPCIKFPSCPFGNRCLYIHPNCRFDKMCQNASCAYTHGGKVINPTTLTQVFPNTAVSTVPIAQKTEVKKKVEADIPLAPEPQSEIPSLSSLTPCRFAAACKTPGCNFKHPKACRFGASCLNSMCYFYHPPSTSKVPSVISSTAASGKYKWKATTA